MSVFKKYFFQTTILSFFLLIILLLLRIFEIFRFRSITGIDLWESLGPAIGYDTKLLCCCLIFGFVFLPLAFWKYRIAIAAFKSILLLMLISHLVLMQYFFINLSLLDRSLLFYSFYECIYIVKMEIGHVGWGNLAFALLMIIITFYFLFSKISEKLTASNFKFAFSGLFIIFSLICFIDFTDLRAPSKRFDSMYPYFFTNNKLLFFVTSFREKIPELEKKFKTFSAVKERIRSFHKQFPRSNYLSNKFPFLYDDPYRNTLGPFFQIGSSKPNLVIVFVESLSRSFSGPRAYYGSFTPFLDSLAKHSLYWENALSNAPRTFGVLPYALASLPEGYPDKISTVHKVPKFNSLIKELKGGGYYSTFFYGSWSGFDNYDRTLKAFGVDSIFSEKNFDTTKFKRPSKNVFVWGYYDNDLFLQSLYYLQKRKEKALINIYLTLGMHSPNDVYPDKYNDQYIQQLINQRKIPANIPAPLQGNIVKSIVYSDDALREFFAGYKRRKDFDNTIFLITGDHNINSLPLRNDLDIYHVPLVIYSPLLKRAASFKSVVSHRDITPSLLSLLQYNFKISSSEVKHWVGSEIDTSVVFKSNRLIPLYMNQDIFSSFVIGDYVLKKDVLYKLSDNLELKNIDDEALYKKLTEKAYLYRDIDSYSVKNNCIIW